MTFKNTQEMKESLTLKFGNMQHHELVDLLVSVTVQLCEHSYEDDEGEDRVLLYTQHDCDSADEAIGVIDAAFGQCLTESCPSCD